MELKNTLEKYDGLFIYFWEQQSSKFWGKQKVGWAHDPHIH